MVELFWRIKSKISEILDKIPAPPDIFINKKFQQKLAKETRPCELCFPKDGKGGVMDLPDDFCTIKLDKDQYTYDIKLANVRPDQWKVLGRNLLNIAYADPMYGISDDDDTDDEDPLPPPPEPTPYVKAMERPLISLNAKGINVLALEELGDLFYNIADYIEMGKNGNPMLDEPTDGTVPEVFERLQEYNYDPVEAVDKERTVNKVLTSSDLIPGSPATPYQDEFQDWVQLCDQGAPDTNDEYQTYTI